MAISGDWARARPFTPANLSPERPRWFAVLLVFTAVTPGSPPVYRASAFRRCGVMIAGLVALPHNTTIDCRTESHRGGRGRGIPSSERWPDLLRPSTSFLQPTKQDVGARHKAGHDAGCAVRARGAGALHPPIIGRTCSGQPTSSFPVRQGKTWVPGTRPGMTPWRPRSGRAGGGLLGRSHPPSHGRTCSGHLRLSCNQPSKTWVPGTRPGMTPDAQ